jgi:hypothetical protein
MGSGVNRSSEDPLWGAIADKHYAAQRIALDNPGVKTVKNMKFPKGTSEDVKKLAKYYKFEQYNTTVTKAYTYIHRAWKLYSGYDYPGSAQRMLEALLAGGCSLKKAAESCGLDQKTVSAYKKYYFDLNASTTQQLKLKCQTMIGIMDASEETRWNWMYSSIKLGPDWFIRTNIENCPTEEDEKAEEDYNRQFDRRVVRAIKAIRVNGENVTEQLERQANMVGATRAQEQKDKELEHKLASSRRGGENTEDLLPKIYEAMDKEGVRPDDVKESAYNKGIPAEEDIPIAVKDDKNE